MKFDRTNQHQKGTRQGGPVKSFLRARPPAGYASLIRVNFEDPS
jgi:hypothetical protein